LGFGSEQRLGFFHQLLVFRVRRRGAEIRLGNLLDYFLAAGQIRLALISGFGV
jgi:hypothetical protein